MHIQKTNTTAFIWGGLKTRSLLFVSFILLPFLYPSPAFCLESAEQILQQLDAHYYYPQKQGLKKLSVRLEWEQLDVVTDSGRYLKNPPIDFFWEDSPAGSKSIFKLADTFSEVSDERRKELLHILENYQEIVIPKTLAQKMARYKGSVNGAKKQKRLIEFVSLDPGSKIRKYHLMIDLENKSVSKFRMERKDAPFEIKSDVRYNQKNGKWLVAESRSKFRVGEMDYQETTEYVYRRAGKFWLVGQMTQTLKMDDRILQSYIFRFRHYQIN